MQIVPKRNPFARNSGISRAVASTATCRLIAIVHHDDVAGVRPLEDAPHNRPGSSLTRPPDSQRRLLPAPRRPQELQRSARALTALYADREEWSRKAVLNIAASRTFSSDRTIAKYAGDIWHAEPCLVD